MPICRKEHCGLYAAVLPTAKSDPQFYPGTFGGIPPKVSSSPPKKCQQSIILRSTL